MSDKVQYEIVDKMTFQTDFRVSHELQKLSISTMTPLEIDFFFAFASDIKKEDEEFKKYTVSNKILCKKMGRRLDISRAKSLLTRISKKQIKIDDDNEFTLHNIFSTVSVNKKTEDFTVSFNSILKPLLLQLDTFILGNTKYLFALESKYQKQMYLLMCQWKSKKHYTTKVDVLMDNLEVPVSMRRWSEFKIKVLDASIKAFFSKSDVIFEYVVSKKIGRSVDEITFTIQNNPHFKKPKTESLFSNFDLSSEFDVFYGKKIKTKQGVFTIVRIASVSDELHIYFDNEEGYLSLPSVAALERAISGQK